MKSFAKNSFTPVIEVNAKIENASFIKENPGTTKN
jgi:hypothetical protein